MQGSGPGAVSDPGGSPGEAEPAGGRGGGPQRSTWPRRLALTAGALAATGALVAGASFALFTSQANAQSDTFTAGTVILGSGSPSCTFANMEPGDSNACPYTVTYTGSLDAWITLSVTSSSTALATYTPGGSQTPIGGEALLNDNSPNGLAVTIQDNQGAGTTPESFSLGTLSCLNTGSGAALGDTGYQDSCTSSAPYQPVNGQGALSVTDCAVTNTCLSAGGDGAVLPGWTDTFTVTGTLPLAAGNIYQGATATVTLQASAVQASNNPQPGVLTFVSDSSWGAYTADPATASSPGPLGSAAEVCLNGSTPYTCPGGAVQYGFSGSAWTAPLTSIPGALWIWAPGVTGSTFTSVDPTVYFSKTFTLPSGANAGTIWVAGDNYADVFVNGVSVGQVGTPGNDLTTSFNQIWSFHVPASDFQAGVNTITVEGANTLVSGASTYQSNPAGVVFGGTLYIP